jgi:aspartate oxidase
VAGRYEEIFAPEMMAPNPSYHFHAGGMNAKLEGQNNVEGLYRAWVETSQCIFEKS